MNICTKKLSKPDN